jgi:hypothetical protein
MDLTKFTGESGKALDEFKFSHLGKRFYGTK